MFHANFFVYLEYREGFYYLKSNHPYFHQIQGQLHLCNKNCCDLIVLMTKDCKIIRITKNSEWTKNIANLIEFYFNTFIPELIQNQCLVRMHIIKQKKLIQSFSLS